MIDTHAHIYLDEFKEDISEVISKSLEVGVEKILLPNIDSESVEDLIELTNKCPDVCYPMLGLHPCSVKENFQEELKFIRSFLEKTNVVAIGEIGTDLYWDKTFWNEQKEAFRTQCEWALEFDLPIVIHSRESIDESIQLVRPYVSKGLTGVFHCFNGTIEQGQEITKMGFYLGLGGVCTFKNAGMDKVIPKLDKDYILLETDSPYLAPVPFRGKRNIPSYLKEINLKISEYLNLPPSEIDDLTTSNAKTLFKLD